MLQAKKIRNFPTVFHSQLGVGLRAGSGEGENRKKLHCSSISMHKNSLEILLAFLYESVDYRQSFVAIIITGNNLRLSKKIIFHSTHTTSLNNSTNTTKVSLRVWRRTPSSSANRVDVGNSMMVCNVSMFHARSSTRFMFLCFMELR
jgi:hypothetical protein